MKNFTLMQWVIVIILSLLTALEPLSIDLYLPGFMQISEAFNTPVSNVQLSLSTFLAGFAIGQLLWGPLADRFGRKKPILLSLFIFIIASVACVHVSTIEQLWVVRFIQAIGGCGGIVISRAVVTDYFDETKTLKIFSLLALIMGIAPILAPSIGNGILQLFNWEGLFYGMAVLGIILFLFTLILLPETNKARSNTLGRKLFSNYFNILKVKRFTVYSLIAGLVNGILMIYVANGPFLIMGYGGFSSTAFSFIFAINALGLMLGSVFTSILQKRMSVSRIVKLALSFMLMMNVVLLVTMFLNAPITVILFVLFFFVFPLGILLPTTTELAITPFKTNSGMASALFGFIQLGVAFICTVMANFIVDNTILGVGISFLICSLLASFVLIDSVYVRIKHIKQLAR